MQHGPSPQSGAATLAIALLLLIATTIMSFALARNSLLEQRILRNELWAAEAFHQAEALLEQALHELKSLPVDDLGWVPDGVDWQTVELPTDGIELPNEFNSKETYSLELRLRRRAGVPNLVEVIAHAQGGGGASAQLRQYLRLESAHHTRVPGTWRDF